MPYSTFRYTPSDQEIIPASRRTTWQPGVTYNGGIPNRTTIFQTINPSGGDDTSTINTACNTCPAGQVVKLGPGTFKVSGNGIFINNTNPFTLRGSGRGPGSAIVSGSPGPATAPGTYTAIWKTDSPYFGGTSPFGNIFVGNDFNSQGATAVDLTTDAVKGTKSCTVTDVSALSVGQVVWVDILSDSDPDIFYNIKHDLSGYINGSLSTTSLTVNSLTNGPTGLGTSGTFNGTLNGTALTVNSVPTASYIQGGSTVVGAFIFDLSNNFYGRIVSGTYPNFTMSQTNSNLTTTLVIGGISPLVGYPIYDSKGSAFFGFINSGTFPNFVMNQSNPTLTNVNLMVGGGSRRFFCRQDRFKGQIMKIAAIDSGSKTVTFETPFHMTYPVTYQAQLAISGNALVSGIGIEDLYLYAGVGGDGFGNLAFHYCSGCWAKNVESHYADGTGIGLYDCYRCEVRDSYMHESPKPFPGGGGYLSGMNTGTADSLFENNIMWCGNKVIVMRGTGGGNVIAYNYLDDAFGATYPHSPEAGLNAAHFGGSHMELLEGNYTHEFKGDGFWGNSIYVTLHRNWISGLRAAAGVHTNFAVGQATASSSSGSVITFPAGTTTGFDVGFVITDTTTPANIPAGTKCTAVTNTTVTLDHAVTVVSGDVIISTFDSGLNNYSWFDGNTTHFLYADTSFRNMCDINAYSFGTNLVGNVLGYSGMGFKGTQNQFVYQNLGPNFPPDSDVDIYNIGIQSTPGENGSQANYWILGQDSYILRQGNWDWFTNSQRWHGIGGFVGSSPPKPIRASYYLSSKPAFWGTTPWPWVDPSTGATAILPAKAAFETLSGLTIPPGNQ